jgi:hypothetical protein
MLLFAGAMRRAVRSGLLMGAVSFWGDEHVRELDGTDNCTALRI